MRKILFKWGGFILVGLILALVAMFCFDYYVHKKTHFVFEKNDDGDGSNVVIDTLRNDRVRLKTTPSSPSSRPSHHVVENADGGGNDSIIDTNSASFDLLLDVVKSDIEKSQVIKTIDPITGKTEFVIEAENEQHRFKASYRVANEKITIEYDLEGTFTGKKPLFVPSSHAHMKYVCCCASKTIDFCGSIVLGSGLYLHMGFEFDCFVTKKVIRVDDDGAMTGGENEEHVENLFANTYDKLMVMINHKLFTVDDIQCHVDWLTNR